MVFHTSLLNRQRGWGQSVMGICALCYIYTYETYVLSWFARDLWLIGGGGVVNLPWVCVYCAIYETDLV